MQQLDVVIPLGPKDEDMINRCIRSVREHVVGVRNIYVISKKTIDVSGAAFINENVFPFSYEYVLSKTSETKAGWYLQQLLKFYAPLFITNILENVLIVDADTVFNKRTKFLDNGKQLYDRVMEPSHQPYLDHMLKLHPSFTQWKKNTSGITNVMLFNRKILIELIERVEEYHQTDFWDAFLDSVVLKTASGASEYEIYFNYVMNNKQDIVRVRPLQWNNHGQRNDPRDAGDWNYVNYHHHQQIKPRGFR